MPFGLGFVFVAIFLDLHEDVGSFLSGDRVGRTCREFAMHVDVVPLPPPVFHLGLEFTIVRNVQLNGINGPRIQHRMHPLKVAPHIRRIQQVPDDVEILRF